MQVEIRVQGQIDEHWSTWFDDMKITRLDPNETVLTGTIRDQAALYVFLSDI